MPDFGIVGTKWPAANSDSTKDPKASFTLPSALAYDNWWLPWAKDTSNDPDHGFVTGDFTNPVPPSSLKTLTNKVTGGGNHAAINQAAHTDELNSSVFKDNKYVGANNNIFSTKIITDFSASMDKLNWTPTVISKTVIDRV